jgi:hypothetical protein
MTPQELANALHGDWNGKWINIRGPGHKSGDRSLGFLLDPAAPEGFRVHSFADDDQTECREYVKAQLRKVTAGNPTAIEHTGGLEEVTEQSKIDDALRIWTQAAPAKGTIVESYLAERKCRLTETIRAIDALRFHASCPFGAFRFPAMVALLHDLITGKPSGILRTALRDDGAAKRAMSGETPAKMILGIAKWSVVKLVPAAEHIGIAEGIETALSAHQIFKLPVWVALSAGGIAALPIIHGLKRLTIFADHDERGMAAAVRCSRRYAAAGIEAEVRYPITLSSDWNDYLHLET